MLIYIKNIDHDKKRNNYKCIFQHVICFKKDDRYAKIWLEIWPEIRVMRGKLLGLNTYFPKQICDYLYLLKISFLGHNKQLENSEWILLSRKTGVEVCICIVFLT